MGRTAVEKTVAARGPREREGPALQVWEGFSFFNCHPSRIQYRSDTPDAEDCLDIPGGKQPGIGQWYDFLNFCSGAQVIDNGHVLDDTRTKSAMTLVIMTMTIIRIAACKNQHLYVIGAAVLWRNTFLIR